MRCRGTSYLATPLQLHGAETREPYCSSRGCSHAETRWRVPETDVLRTCLLLQHRRRNTIGRGAARHLNGLSVSLGCIIMVRRAEHRSRTAGHGRTCAARNESWEAKVALMKRSTPAGARASAAEPSIRTTTSILQTQPADLVCRFR